MQKRDSDSIWFPIWNSCFLKALLLRIPRLPVVISVLQIHWCDPVCKTKLFKMHISIILLPHHTDAFEISLPIFWAPFKSVLRCDASSWSSGSLLPGNSGSYEGQNRMLPICVCGSIILYYGFPLILNQRQPGRKSEGRLLRKILSALLSDLRFDASLSTAFVKHLVLLSVMYKIKEEKRKKKERKEKFWSISSWGKKWKEAGDGAKL